MGNQAGENQEEFVQRRSQIWSIRREFGYVMSMQDQLKKCTKLKKREKRNREEERKLQKMK